LAAFNDALRGVARRAAGREPTPPSAGSIDSETIQASEVGGPTGFHDGKRLTGRRAKPTTTPTGVEHSSASSRSAVTGSETDNDADRR